MVNHLTVEIPKANLSGFMHALSSSYTATSSNSLVTST